MMSNATGLAVVMNKGPRAFHHAPNEAEQNEVPLRALLWRNLGFSQAFESNMSFSLQAQLQVTRNPLLSRIL